PGRRAGRPGRAHRSAGAGAAGPTPRSNRGQKSLATVWLLRHASEPARQSQGHSNRGVRSGERGVRGQGSGGRGQGWGGGGGEGGAGEGERGAGRGGRTKW